jgi:hypothetical protein
LGRVGDLGGIRTHDPRIRNPVLYPAELRDQPIAGVPVATFLFKQRLIHGGSFATWSARRKGRSMRAEIEKTVAEIEQVLTLLRRHL